MQQVVYLCTGCFGGDGARLYNLSNRSSARWGEPLLELQPEDCATGRRCKPTSKHTQEPQRHAWRGWLLCWGLTRRWTADSIVPAKKEAVQELWLFEAPRSGLVIQQPEARTKVVL